MKKYILLTTGLKSAPLRSLFLRDSVIVAEELPPAVYQPRDHTLFFDWQGYSYSAEYLSRSERGSDEAEYKYTRRQKDGPVEKITKEQHRAAMVEYLPADEDHYRADWEDRYSPLRVKVTILASNGATNTVTAHESLELIHNALEN